MLYFSIMTWKQFEMMCIAYLQKNYTQRYLVNFIGFGGSDSTKPDIKTLLPDGTSFYIEAKMQNAQSGQFVVLPGEDGFYFSPKNTDHDNIYSQKIIDYMNRHWDVFKNPGTSGVDIPLPQDLMSSWIKTHYKNKGAQFMMSSNDYKAFTIAPIEKMDGYFKISAKYRIKKSGSSPPSRDNINEIKNLLNDPLADISNDTGKYIINSDRIYDKQKISGAVYSYQFNRIGKETLFEIKRLSNTANPGVIFSLELTQKQQPEDLDAFIAALETASSPRT